MTVKDNGTITLRDIAKHLNLSISTVSRALNGYQHVDEATRVLVREAASTLGYPFDNLRRPRATARPSVLVLTVRDKVEALSMQGIVGVEEALMSGVQRVLDADEISFQVQRTRMRLDEVSSYAEDPRVNGLILLGGMLNAEFIEALQQADIPFVVAGAGIEAVVVNCVTADYALGAERATSFLLTQQRRQIALVNGPSSTQSSIEKYRGFRLGLSLQNRSFSETQVVVCQDFNAESGYAQTRQLLEQFPAVDAILYASDELVIGGLHALKEQGRRVPDDVALVGFYDCGSSQFADPPLTTVQVDLQSIGHIAAKRLLALLNESDDLPWRVVIPTQLVIRHST